MKQRTDGSHGKPLEIRRATIRETARFFAVSVQTVRRLTQAGEIPVVYVKGLPRYDLERVEEALIERGIGRGGRRQGGDDDGE